MYKAPEFWYVVVLTVSLVGYAAGCFYYFNHGSSAGQATLYFGYVVYTALVTRFLFVRWQQREEAAGFSAKSLLLFAVGLLPAAIVGLSAVIYS